MTVSVGGDILTIFMAYCFWGLQGAGYATILALAARLYQAWN